MVDYSALVGLNIIQSKSCNKRHVPYVTKGSLMGVNQSQTLKMKKCFLLCNCVFKEENAGVCQQVLRKVAHSVLTSTRSLECEAGMFSNLV